MRLLPICVSQQLFLPFPISAVVFPGRFWRGWVVLLILQSILYIGVSIPSIMYLVIGKRLVFSQQFFSLIDFRTPSFAISLAGFIVSCPAVTISYYVFLHLSVHRVHLIHIHCFYAARYRICFGALCNRIPLLYPRR